MPFRILISKSLLPSIVLTLRVGGATNCEQEFQIIGLVQDSEGSSSLWLAEHVYGECVWTRLIRIRFFPDSVRTYIEMVRYKDWKSITDRIGNALINGQYEFAKQDSLWRYGNKFYNIKVPRADSSLYQEYKRNLGDPEIWNQKYGDSAVTPPTIGSTSSKMLYYYPYGLYMNYLVERVCMLPGNLLLVFTGQPLMASGFNTMHGFFLLKWNVKTY